MGLFDLFKKNTQFADYNAMLPRFAKNFIEKPDEKTAAEMLKCLANCDIYLVVTKESYTSENANYYPLMTKDNNKLAMLIYSYEVEITDTNYTLVKTNMTKAISVYDFVSKIGVNKMILDQDVLNVKINDAFIRYLKERNKKSLF